MHISYMWFKLDVVFAKTLRSPRMADEHIFHVGVTRIILV